MIALLRPPVPPVPPLNSTTNSAFEGEPGRRDQASVQAGAPSSGSLQVEPGVPPEGGLRVELCDAMATIHQRGWCDGTGGNFSCVLEREPLRLLMAPSGVDKGTVKPQDLITVDGDGLVQRGGGRASAETLLHLTIVRETGAGAVLHTHSQAGTLLSQWSWEQRHGPKRDSGAIDTDGEGVAHLALRNLEMLKGLAGITTHLGVVRIPVLANDQDLGRLSRRAAPHLDKAPKGLLIAGHGLYAWGQELVEARRHLEILEFLLEQRWRQMLLEALLSPGREAVQASRAEQ